MVMDMTGTSNTALAIATGKSRGYVGQVRTGLRVIVPYRFVARAGDYLGMCLGERGLVAVALIVDDPEGNAGE